MPQDSLLYGVARVRCHEKDLLGRDRIRRMADAPAEEALRQLLDAGYGNMADAGLGDVEKLIENQLEETCALVKEVSPDPAQTDLFLLKADIHNLKVLLKLRLTGSREEPILQKGGVYAAELLADMVTKGDYRGLPQRIREALNALELSFLTGVDPSRLSAVLDGAYFAYAREQGDAFTKAYFTALTDFSNLLTLLRLRAMGAEAKRLSELLLPEGEIPTERLLAAMEIPAENLGRALAAGPARDAMLKGLAESAASGRISALEKARDNYLIGLAAEGKGELESIRPIVGYLLAREQEARCVRLILTAKRNGLAENIITERLRELYG